MAYTKNTWVDGDIVTSEKLNHMEDGIANSESVFIVDANIGDMDEETGDIVTQVRWKDIHDAFKAYKRIIIRLIHPSNGVMALAEVVGGEVISLSSNESPTIYAFYVYGKARVWMGVYPYDDSDENSYAAVRLSSTGTGTPS